MGTKKLKNSKKVKKSAKIGRSLKKSSKQSKHARDMDMNDLLHIKLSALYDVERQLTRVLPKMASVATDPALVHAFLVHLTETENHIERLDEVFSLLGATPDPAMTSEGIHGIIKDGEWGIKNIKPTDTLDVHLVAIASYIEHYEMAGYGIAIEWALELGHKNIAEILEQTLMEEIAADEKLIELAEMKLNDKIKYKQLQTVA